MTLATSREQRKTAGNRMSKLLDAEEEDEFYKTTYGGFNDVRHFFYRWHNFTRECLNDH